MESFSIPDNDEVDFTIRSYELPDNDEVDFGPQQAPPMEVEEDPMGIGVEPINLPLEITIPTDPQSLRNMDLPIAVFLIGILGIITMVAAVLRNYIAIASVGFAMILLVFSGLFGIGLELFWMAIVLSVVTLMAGVIMRGMN